MKTDIYELSDAGILKERLKAAMNFYFIQWNVILNFANAHEPNRKTNEQTKAQTAYTKFDKNFIRHGIAYMDDSGPSPEKTRKCARQSSFKY
jgi:hypothetical protein